MYCVVLLLEAALLALVGPQLLSLIIPILPPLPPGKPLTLIQLPQLPLRNPTILLHRHFHIKPKPQHTHPYIPKLKRQKDKD